MKKRRGKTIFHLRCRLLRITWHFPRFATARLNAALRRRYRHPNYRTQRGWRKDEEDKWQRDQIFHGTRVEFFIVTRKSDLSTWRSYIPLCVALKSCLQMKDYNNK